MDPNLTLDFVCSGGRLFSRDGDGHTDWAFMSDVTKRVQCDRHSETPATFVCRHIRFGVACGFRHSSNDDDDDRWPDAWCDLCDAAYMRDGEWNDSNEPEISLQCTDCYEEARARNEYLPTPLKPGQLAVTPAEFAVLATAACERCALRQEETQQAWPKFATGKRWHFDQEIGAIRFFDAPTDETVVADVTIAGSFSTNTNTWMWAWANQNYSALDRAAVDPLRIFGKVRGIEKFQNAHWIADEVDAWEVTQIAADLLGATAIYRMPVGHMLVFMLLDNFRVMHPS